MMRSSVSHARTAAGSLILVNPSHPLPQQPPPALTPVDPYHPNILLERRAAQLLQACIHAVKAEGQIVPVSGWRSQAEQQAIWDETWAKEGEDFTRRYVAIPGCSEHQTGLAIDLGLAAPEIDFIRPNFPEDGVCGRFRRAAAQYGFVLRYPAGKEAITHIAHEPWHFRFVGIPHSALMTELGLTLEEYLQYLRGFSPANPLQYQNGAYRFLVYCLPPEAPAEAPGAGEYLQCSDDNQGGRIITRWRRAAPWTSGAAI